MSASKQSSSVVTVIRKLWLVFILAMCFIPVIAAEEAFEITLPLQVGIPIPANLWEKAGKDSAGPSAPVTIELASDYDPVSRKVVLRAVVCTYTTLSDACRISVVVVEQSPDALEHSAGDISERSVIIRQVVTGPYGESLAEKLIPENICLIKRYSCMIDQQCDTEFCSILACIHDGDEVLQAARIPVLSEVP